MSFRDRAHAAGQRDALVKVGGIMQSVKNAIPGAVASTASVMGPTLIGAAVSQFMPSPYYRPTEDTQRAIHNVQLAAKRESDDPRSADAQQPPAGGA